MEDPVAQKKPIPWIQGIGVSILLLFARMPITMSNISFRESEILGNAAI